MRYSEELVTSISPVVAFATRIRMEWSDCLFNSWLNELQNQRIKDTKNTRLPIWPLSHSNETIKSFGREQSSIQAHICHSKILIWLQMLLRQHNLMIDYPLTLSAGGWLRNWWITTLVFYPQWYKQQSIPFKLYTVNIENLSVSSYLTKLETLGRPNQTCEVFHPCTKHMWAQAVHTCCEMGVCSSFCDDIADSRFGGAWYFPLLKPSNSLCTLITRFVWKTMLSATI